MDSLDLEMDNAEFNKNKTKYFMLRWFGEVCSEIDKVSALTEYSCIRLEDSA